ncbi:tRNA synthetases class II (A)-domain-containing protein [Jimgerdemannia flammicorona]|uniref:alanine--tRNA ligase n=1 Tax=Jimgerdemannia flammicorona TaxID=994334 RepID=A0A433BBD1_9FUNG|nr:tRNA synthetases class II (A)-domain-containing protein [Jimgerdemannia flammicorona]
MVQFKEYFLRPDTAPFKTAVTIQKCMRAGGKHNDLDNVGHTPRHHTFFEMLGNFSFGAYNKAQAVRYAWRFLTEELQLPKDRLRVTVFESDQETFEIWRDQEGLPEDRIMRCGLEDNFWSMGDGEGPCGPCTEIFWDTQDDTNPERYVTLLFLCGRDYLIRKSELRPDAEFATWSIFTQVARDLEPGVHAELPNDRGSARGATYPMHRHGDGDGAPGVRVAGMHALLAQLLFF